MSSLKSFVRVVSLASFPITTPSALAQVASHEATAAQAGMTDVAKTPAKRADRLVQLASPPGETPWLPPEAHRPPQPPPPPGGHLPRPPPPPHLARMLAELETAVGIRTNQFDVWRDFTDALQAVASPAVPPFAPVPPDAEEKSRTKAEAFAVATKLAEDAIERGRRAEALLKAITALRERLTPEQLEKLAQAEQRAGPHPGGPGGRDFHR